MILMKIKINIDGVIQLKKRLIASSLAVMILVLMMPSLYAYGDASKSSIVIERSSGRIMHAKNIHQKMPMASTTKIMTALVAIENCEDLKKKITIDNRAVGIEGSSIYLKHKEKLSMEDLLYGLMLRSGNDGATAIACEIGGSVDGFADMMNKKAKQIGANNSNFMNPHGLHHKEHYTTAYDLALITREAMKHDIFRKIVGSKRWISDREGYKVFYNKNKTLSQYPGGDGVKTGYTKVAGRCLVTSATRDGMQVISVVLNDYNWFNDCYQLMNKAFTKYKLKTIIKEGQEVKSFTVLSGKESISFMAAKNAVTIPLTDSELNKVKIVFDSKEIFKAPIKKGRVLGRAKVYLGDKLMGFTELVATKDIKELTLIDLLKGLFKK